MRLKNILIVLVTVTALFSLTACSQVQHSGAKDSLSGSTAQFQDSNYHSSVNTYDPLEGFNRAVFQFNRYADMLVIKPITQTYVRFLPEAFRVGIHNFLANLNTPVILANELLQLDWHGANIVAQRFLINTTVGMGGLFDAAEYHGISRPSREDFGQTLGKWGVGKGPYLVLPLMGPSNLRDATGLVVDMFLDPLNWWAWDQDEKELLYARAALRVIDARAGLLGPYDDLLEQSIDPYTTVKSAYIQNRAQAVRDQNSTHTIHKDTYDGYDLYMQEY